MIFHAPKPLRHKDFQKQPLKHKACILQFCKVVKKVMKNAFFENSRFCITVPLSHKNMAANDSQPMGQFPSPSTNTTVKLRISDNLNDHVMIKSFVFLISDPQVTQRNLWGAVSKRPLEHCNIHASLTAVIFVLVPTPSFPHGVGSNILLDVTCFSKDGWIPKKREGVTTWYGSKWEPKESKPKTVYSLDKDHLCYTISKTEFDFAEFLVSKMPL